MVNIFQLTNAFGLTSEHVIQSGQTENPGVAGSIPALPITF
jgi:hypothetical protein